MEARGLPFRANGADAVGAVPPGDAEFRNATRDRSRLTSRKTLSVGRSARSGPRVQWLRLGLIAVDAGSIVGSMQPISYAVRDNHAVWAGRSLRAWADELVESIVAGFDPTRIILFGSVATATDGPDSDIDLLVVFDDIPVSERRRKIVELRRATRSIAAPHDLLVTSVVDFERNATRPGSTEYQPALHGVTLYDRSTVGEPTILPDLAPTDRARAERIIAKVGEAEFRRAVATMTGWDTTERSLNDVVCLYVLGLQGRLRPIEMGRRAAELHMTLPARTADDAGFSDDEGRQISREEWLRRRADRLAESSGQAARLGLAGQQQRG